MRTLFSGISRGTEALVFRGEVPRSQWQAMRAPFQEGSFPAPVKYGYMNVGVVEADPAPAGGRGSLEGRTVFCLFPHQDRYVVPASAVVPLLEGVPPGRAVLAANLETALNGVWDGGVLPGDRVAVVGAGVVGLLVAWLCSRIPGTQVVAVDPDRSREGPAAALGVRSVPPPGADAGGGSGFPAAGAGSDPRAADGEPDLRAGPGAPLFPLAPGLADVVFHASGTPDGAASALALAGVESTVVELSWFGSRSVPLPLGEAFHSRRLTLRSSQVGRIPPSRAPRWTHTRRMETVMELLRAPELDVLFTGESPFDELPGTLARLAGEGEGTLCHRIRYS